MMLSIFLLTLITVPLASAEIIFMQQTKEVYSLGDLVPVPATIKSAIDLSGVLSMDLLCNGRTINFYRNGISLEVGEEKKIDASLVLTRNIIGESKGICKIKAILGGEFILTEDFKISDLITLNIDFEKLEFKPGEYLFFEGNALKENGKDASGFIMLNVEEGNSSKIAQLGTINNGFFTINVSVPEGMKAGTYLMNLDAYEEDNTKTKTNIGFMDQNIIIKQVPTSLEVIFENPEVEPGNNLKVKIVLHDQTGEKINSSSFITIKDNNEKILEQTEIGTDKFLEFPILYNQEPGDWSVVAASNKLISEATLKVMEKKSVAVNIINRTVTITNVGNIPYNDTVLIKIGNESLNILVYLEVDKDEKYILTAPEGEYQVEIITGTETTTAEISLTGKVIDAKKASNKVVSFAKYPLIWIFIIFLLGFVTFIMFKRSQQQTFFGYVGSKIPKRKRNEGSGETSSSSPENSFTNSKNKASLSLSIKGDRQNITLVSLKVKNLKELHSKEGNAKETLQKAVSLAEGKKASTYENNNNLFFLLAPTVTRTFSNEKISLKIATEIKSLLEHHNKMFKQKIDFGISLTSGSIVAKQDSGILKFMTLGSLMATSKRLSSASKGEIMLDEKVHNKLRSQLRTKKHEHGNSHFYSVTEIKNVKEHEKFLKHFLHKLEKGEKGEKKK